MIIGHRKIQDFFTRGLAENRLGHAYCFVGAESVGKRTLAQKIAAELLRAEESKLSTHPDFYYIERLRDEKTGKLKKEISIAQARNLRAHFQNRSWLGGFQVMIIDETELLNEESSNALLKIIEEPPQHSVIFLLTTDDNRLLPTIRSRCQSFYFAPVPAAEIARALTERGADKEEAEKIAALSWGRPGQALRLYDDQSERALYYTEMARWQKLIGLPFFEKSVQLEKIVPVKDDSIEERDAWQKIFDLWIVLWREALLQKYQISRVYEREVDLPPALSAFDAGRIRAVIDELQKTKALMGQNINQRLLIEEVLLKF